jgi:ABC-2 type transport system ATP-binding protein
MKQKLALCCVLITQPRILLLDEPTTGVDPVSRREFWDILATVARGGMTVVVATPYLDEAERCDRIALIYEGQIQQIGTLPELRSSLGLHRLELRPENLEAVQQILIQHKTELQTKEQLVEHCLEAKSNGEQQPIVDIQTFGDRLDVLVKDVEAGKAKIHQLLTDQALPLDAINPAATTLENIFVARLRQQRSDPPYVAFPRSRGGNQQWVVESKTPASAVAIAAQNLRKTFGHFQAVKGVNLDIRYGEIYGLLGANGAGKTTTIKMLCGLVQPSSGSVALAGQSRDLRNQEVRRRIGYMSQKFTLYDDLSILQNLEFYCRVYGVPRKLRREKIDWVLASCDLVGREQMLTKQLPGGWKQRVAFGASVMHEPEILFLDEPTSGVDPLARRQFWHLINDFARQGTAVLVTTHYLEEAEHCNRMGFMVDGQIAAQGSPSEIKAAQPGQLIELVVDRPQETAHLLKMQFAPWQVAIFGDRLHLVLDHPEQDLPQVSNLLQSAHLSMLSLRSIPFSLEDAFIGIVQRAKTRNLWD